jgi:hypothetical protein
VRLAIFLVLGGIFLLIVQLTHKDVKPSAQQTEGTAAPASKAPPTK